MNNEFNLSKFNKLSRILKTVTSVFYVVSAIAVIGSLVFAVACFVIPQEYFQAEHFSGNFRFEVDGLISYDISTANVDETTSLRDIFLTIAAGAFVYSVALLFIFRSLRKVLATVAIGNPFAVTNPEEIRKMGVVVILGSFLFPAVNVLVAWTMVRTLKLQGFGVEYSPDLFLLFVGMLLLILSGIFRYGCHLQQEVDETV